MAFRIRRVAVLGAGVMGSGIAAHLANAGIQSLLFDIVPKDATDRVIAAKTGIANAVKAKPAALFRADGASLITPCNFEDHAERLAECDWIVEVVTERIEIKRKVYELVAKHRRPGTIVSSNTSGIPLRDMAEGMPEEMRRHFLITHFFNPVRYMRLLEIVRGADTEPWVVDTMAAFGERALGKGIVYAKDTPNFVANRVGTFGMASVFKNMVALGLGVDAVDAVFGKPMGRPKSAVFRTADVVGLDTLVHVFNGTYANAPHDEQREAFQVPEFLKKLVAAGAIGEKSGAGFYKKSKGASGKTEILTLNLETGEYGPQQKIKFDCIGKAKNADGAAASLKAMVGGSDPGSQLAWKCTAETLIYAANRIPEIADDVVNIDNAMKWGFGWDLGPFESWDALGVAASVARMQADGLAVPAWVEAMLAAGRTSFYARDASGTTTYWDVASGAVKAVPRSTGHLLIADLKAAEKAVDRSVSADLIDIGDGVLLLEFHSKMNALDDMIFAKYAKALDLLDEGKFDALVVGNQAGNAFCAGANIMMILMGAMQQAWGQVEAQVKQMQDLLMRAKYSKKPVVTAPYGLTLGGGVEVAMHSSATRAAGELYMGLVEVGVGLIPAGGGCKELLVRYLGDIPQDIDYDPNPFVQKAFERIGLAKISTSAEEARAYGYLRPHDTLTLDPDGLIADAKATALGLVSAGYQPTKPRTIKLPGSQGRAAIELYLYQMHQGGYVTDHDVTVTKKLAHVLTGGNIPGGTPITEQQLLDLEREAFLSLCGEPKTQARIQNMLTTGKPLRN
jgi:3-hydroxyacyl-CoA dehydrogenase